MGIISDHFQESDKSEEYQTINKLRFENIKFRRYLWLTHGCRSLYGDDGEMQCNNTKEHRPIDFKRDSADMIIGKLRGE